MTAAALLTGLLAGCGAGSATSPDGLRATVEQSRDNENRGLVQLVVHNDGAQPVAVRRVHLRSPAYDQVPPGVFADELGPGERTSFPVPLGAARCDGDGTAGSTVVVGLLDGGTVQEVALAVPQDDPVLPRLHERSCALERLRDAVDVRFGDQRSREGTSVRGDLVLERRAGSAPVSLTDVQSSIVLLLEPTAPLPLALPAGADGAGVPVEVRPVRCDPHALLESKRTFSFPVFVALAGAEPLQVPVTLPEGPGRELVDAALRDHCAAQGVDLG